MFEKYPEIIQTDKTGHRIVIGIRGHRCMNNLVFRDFAEKIITRMVTRYRDNPFVVGYQIDNELEANHCCCPVCQKKFREWVQEKYQDISAVNRAYGNAVWSGEYSDFCQVKPPMGEFGKWLNPSLNLDFNRYASQSTVEYLEFQRKLIHKLDEKALITTNNWLCENMPDFYDLFANLDFVSYDNYPATKLPKEKETLYSHSFHLDLMRGIKKKNFWIMEQLSGSVGSWMPMSPTPRPGMLKGYALQAIAHGADAVLHFRWRTGVSGAEMFWHGILDHSNVPGRRYREFCELCDTVNGLGELDGSVIENQVALLYGSAQEYGFKLQYQAEGMYYMEQLKSLHDAFSSIGVGVDIVDEKSDLSGYEIVLAPTLFITEDTITENLYQFVDRGGCLLLTNRSGVKDHYNKCIMSPLPTVFAELAGVHVEEYDVIGTEKQKLEIVDGEWLSTCPQKEISCTQWCDLLKTDTAQPMALYHDQFYKGTPAVTRNSYGKGTVYYVGTVLEREAYISLAKTIASRCQLDYIENLPLGVEVTYRRKGDKCWRFVFNNTMQEQNALDEENIHPFEMRIREI
jgi:beta-galactosidase